MNIKDVFRACVAELELWSPETVNQHRKEFETLPPDDFFALPEGWELCQETDVYFDDNHVEIEYGFSRETSMVEDNIINLAA